MIEPSWTVLRTPARTWSSSGSSGRRCSTTRSPSSSLDGGHLRHRVAQSQGVHGDEDRPARRAAGRRRLGSRGDSRARRSVNSAPSERRGSARSEDVWPSFVSKVLSFVDVESIRPLRVVVDAANGMAGAMLPPVLERLPQLDVVRCYFEPDGTFPNHEPNPLLPENREFIVAKVGEEKADLGVAYDGDADRCFFVDDTGEFVPGDFVTALLAEAVLAKSPGEKVIYDVRASWAVPETIERRRRDTAREPRRARLHQAADACGGRRLRRRGLGALLLPRLLAGRHRSRAVPRHARAALAQRRAAVGAPPAVPRALLPDRRDQHARRRTCR